MSADETKRAVRCAGCGAVAELERRYTVSNGKRFLWFPPAGWTVSAAGTSAYCPGCPRKERP